VLPPDVPQYFAPPLTSPAGGQISYEPMLFGAARVQLQDAKLGVNITRDVSVVAPITGGVVAVDWSTAQDAGLTPADLQREPVEPAVFATLPAPATKVKNYEAWGRDFARWLVQAQVVELLRHPATGLVSAAGETERDFRIRLHEALREKRDQLKERLREKHGQKIVALQERLRRAQQAVEREQLQSQQQRVQTAVSMGATILGAVLGRRAVGTGTLGRATTAARGASRSYKEAQDVQRAQETVAALQQQLADLEAQVQAEMDAAGAIDAAAEPLETVTLRPKRTGIAVQAVGLAWVPR
jgi:hypothetical protein